MTGFTPHPYQQRGIEMIVAGGSCGLFMDPGLGKTVTTLTGLQSLAERGLAHNILVLAPKRVAEDTWPKEVDKWGHCKLTYSVVLGTAGERIAALKKDAHLYFMNYENIQWLFDLLKEPSDWPFDTVVLDESSKVKSPSTKRFKILRRLLPHTRRVIALTGTPSPNGIMDLWSQVYLLDSGERLGRSFYEFRGRNFYKPNPHGFVWLPYEGAEQRVAKDISDICVSMRAEDYLDLPDFNPVELEVTLPDDAMALYREMERDMIIQLSENETIDAANAAVMTGKCLQISNGAIYKPEEDGRPAEWTALHNAKLDALESLYEELSGAPLLVAYNYKHDLERIQARFKDAASIKDKGAIDKWNQGKIKMLLAQPASAGHGLNLQHGGHHLCWFGLSWSLELYEQFNARLHRQGQSKPVFAYHILGTDTLDYQVLDRLTSKRSVQDTLKLLLKRKAA